MKIRVRTFGRWAVAYPLRWRERHLAETARGIDDAHVMLTWPVLLVRSSTASRAAFVAIAIKFETQSHETSSER